MFCLIITWMIFEDFMAVWTNIYMYRKNSKNWDTWNNYHNCPTIGTVGFYSAVLCSKDADRITNREGPDQTAPHGAVWSGSALFAQTYLSQYLKLLRYTDRNFQRKTKFIFLISFSFEWNVTKFGKATNDLWRHIWQ